MKEFLKSILVTGNYVLSEMEERIYKLYAMDKCEGCPYKLPYGCQMTACVKRA